MTSPTKLNEFNHAEEPARVLLERLGWTYVPRDECWHRSAATNGTCS